jgi:hypothetical protein
VRTLGGLFVIGSMMLLLVLLLLFGGAVVVDMDVGLGLEVAAMCCFWCSNLELLVSPPQQSSSLHPPC